MSTNQHSSLVAAGRLALVVSLGALVAVYALWPRDVAPPATAGRAEASALAFRTKDTLVLAVRLDRKSEADLIGRLIVELQGPDGNPIRGADKAIHQSDPSSSYRFDLLAPQLPADQITLHLRFNDFDRELPLPQVLLAKAHETTVSASQRLFAGSTAAIHCGVFGCRTYADSVPLPGAEVAVRLRTGVDKVVMLHEGTTGLNGIDIARFAVPQLDSGVYILEIATRSLLGEETLKHSVMISNEPRIALAAELDSEKAVVHAHALCLNPVTLKPKSKMIVHFDGLTPFGMQVFSGTAETSTTGIASIDFPIPANVNKDGLRIRAAVGGQTAQKMLTMPAPPAVPIGPGPIRLSLFPEGGRLIRGMENRVYAVASYPDGSPAACDVTLWQENIRFNAGVTNMTYKYYEGSWQLVPDFDKLKPARSGPVGGFDLGVIRRPENFGLRFEGYLPVEQDGNFNFHLTSDDGSKLFVDDKMLIVNDGLHAASTVSQAIKLTKGTHKIVTFMFNLSGPYAFGVQFDGPGIPRQDLGPRLLMTPKGNPPTKKIEDQYKPFARGKTNAAGIAEFRIAAKELKFREGLAWRQKEMLGGHVMGAQEQLPFFDLSAQARDAKDHVGQVNLTVPGIGKDRMRLALDRTIVRNGEPLQIEIQTGTGLPVLDLDLVRSGQTLQSQRFDVMDGKAAVRMEFPPDLSGLVELHASQMLPDGEVVRGGRVIFVQPKSKSTIEGELYRGPNVGGNPIGTIHVRDLRDRIPPPIQAWITFQDQEVLFDPPLIFVTRFGFSTDKAAANAASTPPIAEVLLAAIHPRPPLRWDAAPAIGRHHIMQQRVQGLASVVWQQAVEHRPCLAFDASARRWLFKPDLLRELVDAHAVPAAQIVDPFGAAIDLNHLEAVSPTFTPERFGTALTQHRMRVVIANLVPFTDIRREKLMKDKQWSFPPTLLADMAKEQNVDPIDMRDAWGEPFRLVKLDKKWDHSLGQPQFDFYKLISAGPDGKFGTGDDVLPANTALGLGW